MDSEPPQGGSVLPYHFNEPSEDQPPHQHFYEYTGGGEHIVRHCECGKSWVLAVWQSMIDRSITYEWREIKEEEKHEP